MASETQPNNEPAFGAEGNGLPAGVDAPIESATADVSTIETAIDQLTAPARSAPPAGKDVVEAKSTVDTERDDIAEGYAARRQAANAKPDDTDQPNGLSGDGVDNSTGAESEVQLPASPQLGAAVDPNSLHKIIINGQEHWVKYADLIASAQLKGAAQIELATAKSLVDQSRRLAASAAPNQPDTAETRATPASDQPADGKPALDKAKLHKVVDTLQTGGVEEAAEELANLLADVAPRQPSVDADQIRQIVRQERVQDGETQALTEATKKFVEKFPGVETDLAVNGAFTKLVEAEQLTDIVHVSGYTPEQIRKMAPTPLAVLEMHRGLRQQGVPGLRNERQVLDVVGKNPRFVQLANLPSQPSPRLDVTVDRSERKAQVLQQPPQRGAPPPPSARAAMTRERSFGDAFAEMKAARHQ